MTSLPFQPHYRDWEPPDELLNLLTESGLYTRDKVELVFAFYAKDHHGQGPYASEIAAVLGITKRNVEMRMTELVAQGRAIKLDDKFALKRGQYTHIAIKSIIGDTTP